MRLQYDAVGNRVTRTASNGISNYTYDALNRLTQAVQPDPVDPLQQLTESFTYDPVGNRTASHLATGQVHDAANRLLDDSNFTFSYDVNGNLVEQVAKATGDRTVHTYNVENQLIRVEKFTVAGGINPVLVADYRYDALGRRIAKEITQAGVTTTTRYIYDNEDILLELDGANVLQARYTHGPGIDEPLIMLRGGASFFYHADGLGSVWDLTDNTGSPIRSYTYDSFGQLLAQTGTLANPYTYTARELDPESGLYYYRARYYDARVGRFLQEDPIGIVPFGAGTLNHPYGYVKNSPIILKDPLGLISSCEALGFAKRAAAFSVCLARAVFSWKAEITACFAFCSTAVLTRGTIPALNLVCAICIVGAVVVGTIEVKKCVEEASAIPVDCPEESRCGPTKPSKSPQPFPSLDIPLSLRL